MPLHTCPQGCGCSAATCGRRCGKVVGGVGELGWKGVVWRYCDDFAVGWGWNGFISC